MPAARKSPSKTSLAGDASERVRAIIEAAESAAAQIRSAAEEDAERIRSEAGREAEELLETLRRGVERLAREVGISAAAPRVEAVAEKREVEVPPAPAAPGPVAAQERDEDRDLDLAEDAAVGLDDAAGPAAPDAPAGAGDADRESGRLVALNMALDGASREDVDRYLAENFQLSDRKSLLDEVYATVAR